MKNSTFLIYVSILFLPFILKAQDIKKISWGKIPQEELLMSVYAADSGAEAVVLDDIGTIYFFSTNSGYRYSYEVQTRIKVLTEAGIDQGDILIEYYHADRSENIKGVKAQVIASDGAITKVSDDQIFTEKVNEFWSRKKIACPNVQIGSIIEYSYKIESDRITTPRDWNFQRSIPTRYSQIEFLSEEFLNYAQLRYGYHPIAQNGNFLIAKDVPAMKKEAYITTLNDYLSKIKFQLQGYRNASNVYTPYLNTWEKIGKELLEDISFGPRMYNNGQVFYVWDAIKDEVAVQDDSIKMAVVIYNKVVQQVKWDENYFCRAEKKGDDVFKQKTGTSGEINALIINLLRKAGFDANPVVTSPRSFGLFNPSFPVLKDLRHTFGQVVIGGKQIYFDGTNKNRPFGVLDEEDFTVDALLLKKGKAEIVNIEPQSENTSHSFELKMDNKGRISGDISSKFKFMSMTDAIQAHQDSTYTSYWKNQLSEFHNVEISGYEGKISDTDVKTKIHFLFGEDNEELEDILYIPTGIFSEFMKNPFKLVNRNFPIDFGHLMSETTVFIFEIPEDYLVESLPENLNMSTTNKEISFGMTCSALNNKVQIVRKTSINKPKILVSEYGAVRTIFDKIELKNGDMLVLKKKP